MKKIVLITLAAFVVTYAVMGVAYPGVRDRFPRLGLIRSLITQRATGAGVAYAGVMDRIDLTGSWKFTMDPNNIGQAQNWQKPEFDAKAWRNIKVPGNWEDQGVTQANANYKPVDATLPYSGYAWYRRNITIPSDWRGKAFYLNLGKIDDQDWTYFNGQLIGQTSTQIGGSDIVRSYDIPAGLIKFNQPNVIAVRVLDTGGSGGMVEGPVSLSTGGSDTSTNQVNEEQVRKTGNGRAVPVLGRNEITRGNDKVQVGSDVVVDKGQIVNNTVAVNGDITVSGHVTGDATTVMGDITVENGGVVDGSAVAVNGEVIKRPGAIIKGEATSIAGWRGFNKLPWNSEGLHLGLFFGLAAMLAFTVLAALLIAMFPGKMKTIADTATEQPGKSALYGIVGFLIAVSTAIVFTITLVGIPLMVIEVFLLIAAALVGHICVAIAVGRKLGAAFNNPGITVILSAVLGVIVLDIVKLVPVAGPLVVFVLNIIGFGAVILTGFGTNSNWYVNRFQKKAAESVNPSTTLVKQDPLEDIDDTSAL